MGSEPFSALSESQPSLVSKVEEEEEEGETLRLVLVLSTISPIPNG